MITMTTPTSRALDRARIDVGAYASRATTPGVNNSWAQGTGGFSPMGATKCIEHDGTTTRLLRTRST